MVSGIGDICVNNIRATYLGVRGGVGRGSLVLRCQLPNFWGLRFVWAGCILYKNNTQHIEVRPWQILARITIYVYVDVDILRSYHDFAGITY